MEQEPMTPDEQEDILARVLREDWVGRPLGTIMTPEEHAAILQELEQEEAARQKAQELWGHLDPEALAGMSKLAEEYLQETEPKPHSPESPNTPPKRDR